MLIRSTRIGISRPAPSCWASLPSVWSARKWDSDEYVRPTIEAFFTERLVTQRQASQRTVAAYRDTLSMLLVFAQARTGKARPNLTWPTWMPS